VLASAHQKAADWWQANFPKACRALGSPLNLPQEHLSEEVTSGLPAHSQGCAAQPIIPNAFDRPFLACNTGILPFSAVQLIRASHFAESQVPRNFEPFARVPAPLRHLFPGPFL